jgi:cytochrome c-type biogenesis protein CcmH/NrfG
MVSDAVGQFRAAVALRPGSPDAHLGLAMALFRTPGKTPEEAQELQTVLRLQPGNPQAQELEKLLNAGR